MSSLDRPIRVLYVARAPFISGAERALRSMLMHLDRRQVEPYLVLGCSSELIQTAEQLEIPVRVIGLPRRSLTSAVHWWISLKRLGSWVSKIRPEILHANDVPSCQAMCRIGNASRIPRVVHVRWTIDAASMSWWTGGAIERVLCISEYVRQTLGPIEGSGLAGSKVEVIADCVDWPAKVIGGTEEADIATGDRPDSASLRESGGAGEPQQAGNDGQVGTRIVLGFAGQLIPSKGLDLVIRGLAGVPEDRRPHLMVAGRDTQTGGSYQRELEALAVALGVERQITWLGFLDRPGDLYQKVDAVVCPSREEPLGLVPLEAAEFARPAIACAGGGLVETIKHGVTGWHVQPDPRSWATFLSALPDRNELRRAGREARQQTLAGYSPAAYWERLTTIYRSLVGRSVDEPAATG